MKKKKLDDERNNVKFRESIYQKDEGGILAYNPAQKRNEYYYLGIIDILMQYSGRKIAEHLFRSIVVPADELSSVNPRLYCDRFNKFLKDYVFAVAPSENHSINRNSEKPTLSEHKKKLLPDVVKKNV